MKSWKKYLEERRLAELQGVNQDPASQEIMKRPDALVPPNSPKPAAARLKAQTVVRTAQQKNMDLGAAAKAVGIQGNAGIV